jgi:hypothetical protein
MRLQRGHRRQRFPVECGRQLSHRAVPDANICAELPEQFV